MQTSGASTSEIRWLHPRRSSPGLATTTASYSPLSTFLNRVSTFPRKSRRSRSGRRCFNCACRRRLLVPTRAPCRRFASVEPTRQSRTSSRRHTAGNMSREGMSVGTSFTLCTARSIVSSSNASSSSLIKIPFAANLRQRLLLFFVAAGFDDDVFRFHARGGKQFLANGLPLPLGEHAAARADPQDSHGFSPFG